MLVVALLPAAISTGVCACKFRSGGAGSDADPSLPAMLDMGSPDNSGTRSMSVWPDTAIERKPFETAMTGRYAGLLREPEMAQLMERIRKVE